MGRLLAARVRVVREHREDLLRLLQLCTLHLLERFAASFCSGVHRNELPACNRCSQSYLMNWLRLVPTVLTCLRGTPAMPNEALEAAREVFRLQFLRKCSFQWRAVRIFTADLTFANEDVNVFPQLIQIAKEKCTWGTLESSGFDHEKLKHFHWRDAGFGAVELSGSLGEGVVQVTAAIRVKPSTLQSAQDARGMAMLIECFKESLTRRPTPYTASV